MIINPIKTPKILPSQNAITEIFDSCLLELAEKNILVVASKIIALCEGRVVSPTEQDRENLITQYSDYYLPPENSKYGHHFTIIGNTLVGSAGIDESNSAGSFVLWPKDPQASANQIRKYLIDRFDLAEVGVVINDSVSIPMRRGAIGTCIAHSGFEALHDYRGTKDLFDHEYQVSVANLSEGLAAGATAVMGEGAEQTPLAIISDVPFIKFQDRDPTPAEVGFIRMPREEDLFDPFLKSAPWQKGSSQNSPNID